MPRQSLRTATRSWFRAASRMETICARAALAKFAPIMQPVKRFAASGGLVLGICNGFQILTEAGLLPGALMRNAQQHYVCKHLHLRCETDDSPFTRGIRQGELLRMPVGHMEGNYFCDAETLAALNREDRVAFRYASATGETTARAQCQRFAREHCRRTKRGTQRAGDDAASGTARASSCLARRMDCGSSGRWLSLWLRLAEGPVVVWTFNGRHPSSSVVGPR